MAVSAIPLLVSPQICNLCEDMKQGRSIISCSANIHCLQAVKIAMELKKKLVDDQLLDVDQVLLQLHFSTVSHTLPMYKSIVRVLLMVLCPYKPEYTRTFLRSISYSTWLCTISLEIICQLGVSCTLQPHECAPSRKVRTSGANAS